jgi:hypothetical protein
MKGKSLLGLTTQIYDALSVKLKSQNVLVVCLEFSLLKSVQGPIEEEKVLILGIVRHNNQKGNDSVEHIVELLVRLAYYVCKLSDASFYERVCLRYQVVRKSHFT